MADFLKVARDIAHWAHVDQGDKAGRPYIEHVARVAAACADDPVAEAVAWLHDVAEDAPRYYAVVVELMPSAVVVAVDLLDRNIAGDYYGRIRSHPIALRVKLADIADNTDEARLALLDDATASRLRKKYARALAVLGVGAPSAPPAPSC